MNFFLSILLVFSFITGFFSGCTTQNTSKIQVATSTSLLKYIVQQVGGDNIDVLNIVPPNQHPGNFDASPGDIQKLTSASLFILHGWPGEGYAGEIIAAANNPDLKTSKVTVDGNWMIPDVQSAATGKVMTILSEIDTRHSSEYRKSAADYQQRIISTATSLQKKLTEAGVSEIKLIASARQADFLQWAGFKVVATFSNAQALTPQTVKDLVDQGKIEGVALVVNNLQDGRDAGTAVALELDITSVNLSNFPGGFENTETWEKAIGYNVDILLEALNK
jgi:zinc transport system substrate-binding protein